MRRAGFLASIFATLATGCLVEIHHVDDPSPAFALARAEAAQVSRHPGPAHEVNVLAYEPDDQQLVKVSVPMSIARKIVAHEGADVDLGDEVGERVRGRLHHRLRLEDLEKAGRGVLVEVSDDDGGQVLVWLR